MLNHTATIVVDLGFGDSGKGTIVDFVARTSPVAAVVRFNGGAQAAHNVHTPDGRHHTFAQFGSGTFVPGVRTHLSRFVLVDPPALLNEAEHLARLGIPDALARLTLDEAALVVTPYHKAANRIREVLRGSGKHGSVGMGVGETMADRIAFPDRAVYVRDLRTPEILVEKFRFFQKLKYDEFHGRLTELARDTGLEQEVRLLTSLNAAEEVAVAYWQQAMRLRIVGGDYLRKLSLEGNLVFEGAQGVLIDEWHGFHPFTTWSATTFDNALTLLTEIGFAGTIKKLGVLRSYFTRHGAGPFPTEQKALGLILQDTHNTFGRWQEAFRVGWFDTVLARYAITASGGIDALAITNLDRVENIQTLRVATAYHLTMPTRREQEACVGEQAFGEGRMLIRSFKRKPFLTDLGYQEVLTGIAQRAVPQYVNAPRGEGFVSLIERELGVPVTLTSYGPTALDKRRRSPLAFAA